MTTTTRTPADTGRTALTTGLRELAAFLDQHPDLPTHRGTDLHYCVPGDNDQAGLTNLAAIADTLGVEVTGSGGMPVDANASHFEARKRFGPVVYRAVYITKAEMADYHALTSYSTNIRADQSEATR